MQQNRGTMCKSLHAGKAAANGVLAALLAERGFDSSQEIIEGARGFCRIYSDRRGARAIDRRPRRPLADRDQRAQPLCVRRGASSAHRCGDRDPQSRPDRSGRGQRHQPAGSPAGAVDHGRGRAPPVKRPAVEIQHPPFGRGGARRRRGRHCAIFGRAPPPTRRWRRCDARSTPSPTRRCAGTRPMWKSSPAGCAMRPMWRMRAAPPTIP